VENLKKRLAENSLNNHFLPLAKTSSCEISFSFLLRGLY